MVRTAADFYHWLKSHAIEPDDVALIVRAKDDMTRSKIEVALRRDLEPSIINNAKLPLKMKGLKIHGVSISVSSLDSR